MSTERARHFRGLPVKTFDPERGLEGDPSGSAWLVDVPEPPTAMGENLGCLLGLVAGGVGFWYWRRAWAALASAVLMFAAWETLLDRVRRRQRQVHGFDADPSGLSASQRDQRLGELRESSKASGARLAALAMDDRADQVSALIVNDFMWFSGPALNPLRLASHRLSGLRSLFVGDLTQDEIELSWLELEDDLADVLGAFPHLEHLKLRGSFEITPTRHERLLSFTDEGANLSAESLGNLLRCEFPQLEELELWMGDPSYGCDTQPEDFERLWTAPFPKLRKLALRNSTVTDELVAKLVESPLIEQLEVLDLSLGTLSDEGAERLLACPAVGRLRELDIHFHYVSQENVARLAALPLKLDASDAVSPDGIDLNDDGQPIRFCAIQE